MSWGGRAQGQAPLPASVLVVTGPSEPTLIA